MFDLLVRGEIIARVPLELIQLQKQYRDPDGGMLQVVSVPHFELADKQHIALRGPSGTGKTTLLHLIAGIVTPDSGKVLLNGTDVAKLGEAQRDIFRGQHVGCIFQQHHLLDGFTALENVMLGMSFAGRTVDRSFAEHLLDEVGMSARLKYQPTTLSIGQRQRVAVARALANKPSLVLADEPTGALDPKNAAAVAELIARLCNENDAMLLLVSHDEAIVQRFGTVVNLDDINHAGESAESKDAEATTSAGAQS